MPPNDAGDDGPADDLRLCELVITAPDADALAGLSRDLLDQRLVACGHHIELIRSIYRWDGAIEHGIEARVNLHTRRDLVPAIVERVKARHPYDVPCVLALPVVAGNPDYLDWVVAETRTP